MKIQRIEIHNFRGFKHFACDLTNPCLIAGNQGSGKTSLMEALAIAAGSLFLGFSDIPCPILSFIDPWGYKGLSLQLISSAIAGWGCDCIFFFNYNRVNPALPNPRVEKHINDLFGKDQADLLREQVVNLPPDERESRIVQAIGDTLKKAGGSYFQDFCFKNEDKDRTSHYLIFVSKNDRGHKIMRDIMARYSSTMIQGVPSFKYDEKPVQLSILDS